MKQILSQIALARTYIKSQKLKKDGENTFSKYSYYTPEYVDKLVTDACNEVNIICIFNMKCDQFGYFGEVITTCLESGESLITEFRTEKPAITATNATQQMGGMNTYTKRYALMCLFNIEDNTSDFDSQDNTKPAKEVDNRGWLNKFHTDKKTITEEWKNVIAALQSGKYTIAQVESKYKISKENKTELLSL